MLLRRVRRRRPFQAFCHTPTAARSSGRRKGFSPLLLTIILGVLLSWGIISLLEVRLKPLISASARTQVQNAVVDTIEKAVAADLEARQVSYAGLVEIQRDSSGTITALSTDMAALNLLRSQLVEDILTALKGIDVSQIDVPLGVLLDSDLFWGRGPSITARALSVGTVSAEFESRFTSAGVNQTLHRVWLAVSVPVTILLPGGAVEVPLETRLCIAETVIVGQVPGTYLQMGPAGG